MGICICDFDASSAAFSSPSCFASSSLRSCSYRATLSAVNSLQNGGGFGNVEESECGSCSAMIYGQSARSSTHVQVVRSCAGCSCERVNES